MLDRFVAYNAHRIGDAVAFANLARHQSYGELEAVISRLARALEGLRSLEVRCVAVQCPDTWRHWSLTLALGRLGLASASLPNGVVSSEELAVLRPDLIIIHGVGGLTEGEGRLVLGEAWFSKVLNGVERDGPASYYAPVPVASSAPCRMALACGTGRDMKLMELSFSEVEMQLHRLIHHDMIEFFMQEGNAVADKPQLLCSIGLQSLSGFLMAGAALAGGTVLRSSDSQNIGTEVMQASNLMVVMSPAHLKHLLRVLPPGMEPMRHVHLTVIGGRLSRVDLEKTEVLFTPHVLVAYGTDECGLVTVVPAGEREGDGDVGLPMPWAGLEIVDEEGIPLSTGRTGVVRIWCGSKMDEHQDGAASGMSYFREGWFYPGDRGFLSSAGRLHLKGRVDELVNVGGAKFDLGVVEELLCSEPRIQDVGVFIRDTSNGERQVYAALVAHESFDDRALSMRLRQRYAALPPIVMIWVSEIPRTREGLVDRSRLGDSLEAYIQRELEPR